MIRTRSSRAPRLRRLLAGMLAAGGLLATAVPALAQTAGIEAADADPGERLALPHEFYFTRGIYHSTADSDPWGARWAIDFPEADQHFLVALRRLSAVDAFPGDNAREITGPPLRDYPFLYVVEAGALDLDDTQARSLAEYLLAGGFMMIDDFWGTWAWDNLTRQLERIFPGRTVVDVPLDHPVFHSFYDINELLQVPNVALAGTGRTHEYDGRVPHTRGVFDDHGRLMVLINWNTDLGDAWEWADNPDYPLRYSNFAYQMGINIVIYGMSY
jgi:hypothetical protein